MDIRHICEKIYPKLLKDCNPDVRYANSKTEEDYLNDIVVKAIKKYDGQDITYDEGKNYLEKVFAQMKIYKMNQLASDPLKFTDSLEEYMNIPE